MSFIWSKTRNRLGPEKAKKLATVYRALRPKELDMPAPAPPTSEKQLGAFVIAESDFKDEDEPSPDEILHIE